MLTIRDAQIEVLRDALERDFLRRAESELQRLLPEQCALVGDELSDLVRHAYDRASGYDLTRDYDILRFINLTFALGPGFDVDLPWAAELFGRTDLDPKTRIDLVDQQATIELNREGAQ